MVQHIGRLDSSLFLHRVGLSGLCFFLPRFFLSFLNIIFLAFVFGRCHTTQTDIFDFGPGIFAQDGIHYNKQGLGCLATSMKKWARENGHSFKTTFRKSHSCGNNRTAEKGRNSQWRNSGLALVLKSFGKR